MAEGNDKPIPQNWLLPQFFVSRVRPVISAPTDTSPPAPGGFYAANRAAAAPVLAAAREQAGTALPVLVPPSGAGPVVPSFSMASDKIGARDAQASKRGAGAMPSVSYGGIPAGGLTIDQALKFLTVTKPMSPGEQAQTALLGRAAQQRGQIEQYLGTLKPTAPNYQQEVQAADQRMRNNLLDVLGGNLFQNYLAGRTVGQ